jgi:hypothetical protein
MPHHGHHIVMPHHGHHTVMPHHGHHTVMPAPREVPSQQVASLLTSSEPGSVSHGTAATATAAPRGMLGWPEEPNSSRATAEDQAPRCRNRVNALAACMQPGNSRWQCRWARCPGPSCGAWPAAQPGDQGLHAALADSQRQEQHLHPQVPVPQLPVPQVRCQCLRCSTAARPWPPQLQAKAQQTDCLHHSCTSILPPHATPDL